MSNWFYLNELIYFNNCSNNVQRHRALVNMALYKCCILLLLLLLLLNEIAPFTDFITFIAYKTCFLV